MNAKQEEEAVFWCGLLALVLFGRPDKAEERRQLRELSKQEVVFPSGRKGKPSLSTLKRKLKKYRQGGFNAMGRQFRNDRGRPRGAPPEVIATAIAAKKDQPQRSALMLNQILEQQHGKTVPRSTLYRHLKDAGATRVKLGVTKKKVRKRWTCEHTHDMWAGDFEYGPYVLVEGKSVTQIGQEMFPGSTKEAARVSASRLLRNATDDEFDKALDILQQSDAPIGIVMGQEGDSAKVQRITRRELEDLWRKVTTLESDGDSLTKAILVEALEGGDCTTDVSKADASADVQMATKALYQLAQDVEDFANAITERAQG